LFIGSLQELNRKIKSQIFVGASAMCWALWLTQNDVVFDKAVAPSYLQIIFKGTLLQKEEDRHIMKAGCRIIETTTIEVFARHG